MKTRILLWSVVSILILGLAAGAFWWLRRPQVMVLDDTHKIILLGVDYGKHHVPPISGARSFDTPKNALVIWTKKEHKPDDYLNTQYYLYDKAGTACVGQSGRRGVAGSWHQAMEIQGVQFDAFPRRQGKFYLTLQYTTPGQGETSADQKFVIRNPVRGSFPNWTPDSLPNMQSDGDLDVTLTKLVVGAAMPYTRDNDDPDDVINKGVQATFHVERNGKPVTDWAAVSVETSDATGNDVNGMVAKNEWNGNDDAATYQYGLWPDEPAWKLRVEFSQQSDFSPEESWSVQGIPLQPGRQMDFWNYNNRGGNTGPAFAETDLNGFHLKIFPPEQFTNVPPNAQPQGGLIIQTEPPLPEGMQLTLVKLTDDQTNDIGYWNPGAPVAKNNNTYRYALRDLGGATNLNLTIALHKSRFVEFTAKPETAPTTTADQ